MMTVPRGHHMALVIAFKQNRVIVSKVENSHSFLAAGGQTNEFLQFTLDLLANVL